MARQQAINSATIALISDPRFAHFIEVIRQNREMAIENLSDGNVIKSERATCACIGEIAAYKSIIQFYDDKKSQVEQHAQMAEEQAAQRAED